MLHTLYSGRLMFWWTALLVRRKERYHHVRYYPFLPLSKDYIHALHQLCTIHMYSYKERLGYDIGTITAQRNVQDRTKQYHFIMRKSELTQCKVLKVGQ